MDHTVTNNHLLHFTDRLVKPKTKQNKKQKFTSTAYCDNNKTRPRINLAECQNQDRKQFGVMSTMSISLTG